MKCLVVALMLVASVLPAAGQETREETIKELAARLADIQATLVPREAHADFAWYSSEWGQQAFQSALEKAEATARWISGNRHLKLSGITASASWPPSIDIHFDIVETPPTP